MAWSFEGNGIRTRTTFISAFHSLGLAFTELPNLLKTEERTQDLAGYLDPFYDIYVIRESNHARLKEFSRVSRRPVINAMSDGGHPCEVLSDAAYIDAELMPIGQAHICLFGPTSNVFHSWHQLAQVLNIRISHVCAASLHRNLPNVSFAEVPPGEVDIVITDGWPKGQDTGPSLTRDILARMGNPRLLPTPPFSIGRELSFDPVEYGGFVGYQQKRWLLHVQKAILFFLLSQVA